MSERSEKQVRRLFGLPKNSEEGAKPQNYYVEELFNERFTKKHIEFIGYEEETFLVIKLIRTDDQMPILLIRNFNLKDLKPSEAVLRQNLLSSTQNMKFTAEPECKVYKQSG